MATLEQAKQQIEENGALLPDGHPIADGKFHRYGLKKKYWYKLNEIETEAGGRVHVGSFGYWQGDNENTQNIAVDWRGITPEEREAAERKRRFLEEQEREKKAQEAQNAAIRAGQQWAQAAKEGVSPYMQRKQITAPGIRYLQDGTALIPMVLLGEAQPRLVGLQKIGPDGSKRFNSGTAKQGACCPIGRVQPDDQVVFIAEGYATGRSARLAMDDGVAGFVAFDAGNLTPVATLVRQLHPMAHILFLADDDFLIQQRLVDWLRNEFKLECPIQIDGVDRQLTASDGTTVQLLASWRKDARGVPFIEADARAGRRIKTRTFENTGVARATAAARAVGNASIVTPYFAQRGENKWTDFNDLHVNESLDAVQVQLAAAILAALAPHEDAPVERAPISAPSESTTSAAAGGDDNDPPPWLGEGSGETTGAPDPDWKFRLARSDKGNILPTLSNVYTILENHEDWNGVIAYDEFSGQVVKLKPPPFAGAELGEWSDMDDLRCTLWMQQKYGFAPRQDVVMGGVLLVADLCKYHVVRNYLGALAWDSVPRLERWLVDRLGADDTPYNRTVARKWLIAAVARVYKPGCKADNVLILEGEQGIYKSTALKVLGGDWFTDAPFRLGDKDAYVVIRGKWIVELAELDSFNKAESTGAKLFFGQYIDRYRNFYGKRATDVPRQQLFAGTTNSDAYLKDDTGNRRYWPVKVTKVDLEGLKEDRDQIWAEAVHLFRSGAEWWPTSAEKDMFEEQQDARYVGDAYIPLIREWLVGKSLVTMAEIMSDGLKLDIAKWTRPEQQRVGRCMAEIGWKRERSTKVIDGKRDWVYKRPANEAAQQEAEDGPL
jgi:putative DNA primase/helicase